MSEERRVQKGWVNAGIALWDDPTAAVPCPSCGQASLVIKDVRSGMALERWITCPSCKRTESMVSFNSPPDKDKA